MGKSQGQACGNSVQGGNQSDQFARHQVYMYLLEQEVAERVIIVCCRLQMQNLGIQVRKSICDFDFSTVFMNITCRPKRQVIIRGSVFLAEARVAGWV